MTQPVHTSYFRSGTRRGLTNSSTASAFPNSGAGPIATTTEPVTVDSSTPTSNALVVDCKASRCDLVFFGTDAANEIFDARIVLWSRIDGATPLWVPVHIADIVATLGAKVGVAGAAVANTEFFADTLVGDAYSDDAAGTGRVQIFSPAGDASGADLIGIAAVDLQGHEKIGVYFDLNTAASANVAYAFR